MRRKRIAVLMAGLDREYQQYFARGVADAARKQNIDLCIFNCQGFTDSAFAVTDEAESRIFDLPVLQDFDGIIALCQTISNTKTLEHVRELLAGCGVGPQVIVDAEVAGAVKVTFDDNNSLCRLMEHLLEDHAYTRFAMVTGPKGNPIADERAAVCIDTVRSHGCELPEERILDGKWTREGGFRAADQLLKQEGPLPEVIVCGNDDIAFGVYDRLELEGIKVPEQVKLTGFDARREAVGRGLTTINRPVENAGAETVHILHEWMEGRPPKGRYVSLPTEVVFGDSCGCSKIEADAKYYVRMLSNERRVMEQALLRGSAFSNALAGVAEETDIGSVIASYSRRWGLDEMFVCVEPDFLTPAKRSSSPYPREMLMLSGYSRRQELPQRRFETRMLVPGLDSERDNPVSLVFSPLYYMEHTFGYAVFDLAYSTTPALFSVTAMISGALMNLSLQNTVRSYASALESMSEHDPLTGLYNRRGYLRMAPELFRRAKEEQYVCAVISVDMDGMKQINDRYGHQAGDEAIIRMGQAMRVLEKHGMTCVHISGDEFVAIGLQEACGSGAMLYECLQAGIGLVNEQLEEPLRISASIGVYASVPTADETLDVYLKHADRLMYENKRDHHKMRE